MYKSAAEKRAEKAQKERYKAWEQQCRDRGKIIVSETAIRTLDNQVYLLWLALRQGDVDINAVKALRETYNLFYKTREKYVSMQEFYRQDRESPTLPENVVTLEELRRQKQQREEVTLTVTEEEPAVSGTL